MASENIETPPDFSPKMKVISEKKESMTHEQIMVTSNEGPFVYNFSEKPNDLIEKSNS